MKHGAKGQMNIDFSETYDQEDDIYYVTFNTGEPSYCTEVNDMLLLERGMFSNLPTGFRILNFCPEGNGGRLHDRRYSLDGRCMPDSESPWCRDHDGSGCLLPGARGSPRVLSYNRNGRTIGGNRLWDHEHVGKSGRSRLSSRGPLSAGTVAAGLEPGPGHFLPPLCGRQCLLDAVEAPWHL